MTDPFADFEDQQFSHDLLEQNRSTLAEEAREFLKRSPGVEAVGLILDEASAEAKQFTAALAEVADEGVAVAGFLGVVPRDFAVAVLRDNCPAALDNLPNGELGAVLPVLVSMKRGFRFCEVSYSAWG